MNRIITLTLMFFIVNGFSQNEMIKKSIVEGFQYYYSESNYNSADTYSCVFDSTTINYQIAFHTHLMENSLNLSGCSYFFNINDTITLFIRSNSKLVSDLFEPITQKQLMQANLKYINMPMINGERRTLVITLDNNFNNVSIKWYEYHEEIPANLWDISNELINKWNDSISGLNKN